MKRTTFKQLIKINQPQFCQQYDLKTNLIKCSLQHIIEFGWNEKAISQACLDLDLSSSSNRILENGCHDILLFMLNEWKDRTETNVVNNPQWPQMNEPDKIRYCIRTRLQYQMPYMNRWHEAMGIGLLSQNFTHTFQSLWQLSSMICQLSLDQQSSNMKWYLDRTVVLKLFLQTELFMLTDTSPNYEETWNFLQRRMDDLETIKPVFQYTDDYFRALGYGLSNLPGILQGMPDNPVDSLLKYKDSIDNIDRSESKDETNK